MPQSQQMPTIGKPTTRRQHYVPRFFLNGFTKNDRLAVLTRENKLLRNQKPENVGFEKLLYETPADPNNPNNPNGMTLAPNSIEQVLAVAESCIAPQYRDIIAAIRGPRIASITDDGLSRIIADLSIFTASMVCRSPEYLNTTLPAIKESLLQKMTAHGYGTTDSLLALLEETTGETLPDATLLPEQVAEYLAKTLTVMPIFGDYRESPLCEMANILRSNYSFELLHTTCCPFVGISTPYIRDDDHIPMLIFPLHSRVCLICAADDQHMFTIRPANRKIIQCINTVILHEAPGLKFCKQAKYLEVKNGVSYSHCSK